MNFLQRLVLMLVCAGLVHSSIVPPVKQPPLEVEADGACRYAEFTERQAKPFTRTFEVRNGDTTALLTEYGLILGGGGFLFMLFGALGGGRRQKD